LCTLCHIFALAAQGLLSIFSVAPGFAWDSYILNWKFVAFAGDRFLADRYPRPLGKKAPVLSCSWHNDLKKLYIYTNIYIYIYKYIYIQYINTYIHT
jgi:hypothetical protein